MTNEILGPYAEARVWLLNYLKTARFANAILEESLKADWTSLSSDHAAYILGSIWGRLRQVDNSLEERTDYSQLVLKEFESARNVQDR